MYSQDLPDWEIYFPTLKDYDRLYGSWVFLFVKNSTKSVSLISRLLEAVFYLLTNILCKHPGYNQVRVEQIRTISPSFCCQILLRWQSVVKPYRHAEIRFVNQCAQLGTPKNTRLACTQAQARLTRSPPVMGFQVPVQTWTPSSRTWGPVLRPPPIPASNQSVRKEPEPMTRE
jgi:hypothetical protein